MLTFVFVFGVVIAGVGIFGIGWPAQMTSIIGRVTFTNRLRYVAAAFRLAVGAILYLVAEQTDFPLTMKVLAGFSVLSGVVVLFISQTTLQVWVDSVPGWPAWAMRGISLLALLLGGFLVVAAI